MADRALPFTGSYLSQWRCSHYRGVSQDGPYWTARSLSSLQPETISLPGNCNTFGEHKVKFTLDVQEKKVDLAAMDALLPSAHKPLPFLWRAKHGVGRAHWEFMESRICKDHRALCPPLGI